MLGAQSSGNRSPIELFLEAKRARKTNRGTDPVRVELPGAFSRSKSHEHPHLRKRWTRTRTRVEV